MTCYNLYFKKLNSCCGVAAGKREWRDCCGGPGEDSGLTRWWQQRCGDVSEEVGTEACADKWLAVT